MNRIDRKHVDFLICDPGSMAPALAVELDDGSHARPERRKRDRFVDRVFATAGLPLARIPAQAQYNTDAVKAQLREALAQEEDDPPAAEGNGTEPEAEPEDEPQDDMAPPACPTCGTAMVLRVVKRRGPRQGERFWGCPHFPKCRGTRDLEDN